MADHSGPSVSVLCAYPVSDVFDQRHRAAYYVALAIIVLAPIHRWLTPAAFSFVSLYSLFSTFYIVALFVAPTRLGPTLDVFPLHSVLLVNTYALATVVFCRSNLIKGRRGWARCMRMFILLWGGFLMANFTKMSFERMTKKITRDVPCFTENSASSPVNVFSIGNGLACENPCARSSDSLVFHPAQDQIRPILWGSVDAITKQFKSMPHPSLSTTDYMIVILFGVALSSTLWLNFFTSPQITRNAVFATFARGRTDSGVRVGIAKVIALTWFIWSYFALLIVAIALPFVAYVQEMLLSRYPTAGNTCIVKQWLPWAIGVCLALVKVAVWRRRRQQCAKIRACRVRRFNNALRQLRCHAEHMPLLPEHQDGTQLPEDSPSQTASSEKSEEPEPAKQSEASTKKFRIQIAEVRKINGLFDGLRELKAWWVNPSGEQGQQTSNLPSADEEKALLKEHYEN